MEKEKKDASKEAILSKLEKLQNLANSKEYNPHEAEVAMRMMKEIMQEYSISINEIQGIEAGEIPIGYQKYHFDAFDKKGWTYVLLRHICQFYDTRYLVQTNYEGKRVILIGSELDRIASIEIFRMILTQIELGVFKKIMAKEIKGRDSKSFCYGIVATIGERLVVIKEEMRTTYSTSLVIVKTGEMNKYIREVFNPTQGTSKDTAFDTRSYLGGKQFGNMIDLGLNKKVSNTDNKMME